MEKRLVSVVIPTYKRSETLERAIQSVLDQTHSDLEVIIVDDNEPDDEYSKGVQERLRAFSDSRLRYVQQERHINGSAARNAGINAANGEYIGFLDDDDVWYRDKIEKQLKVFESDESIGLVYTGAKAIYVTDQISYNIKPQYRGDLSKQILFFNCIGTTSTVLVKKSVLEEAGLFDIEMPAKQDYDLWIRICQITKIGCVEDIEIDYINERGGAQISSNTQKYETAIQRIDEKYSDLFEKLDKTEKDKRQQLALRGIAYRALRNGDKPKARYYLRKCLTYGFDKRTIAFYLLSPFNYRFILWLRKFKP